MCTWFTNYSRLGRAARQNVLHFAGAKRNPEWVSHLGLYGRLCRSYECATDSSSHYNRGGHTSEHLSVKINQIVCNSEFILGLNTQYMRRATGKNVSFSLRAEENSPRLKDRACEGPIVQFGRGAGLLAKFDGPFEIQVRLLLAKIAMKRTNTLQR